MQRKLSLRLCKCKRLEKPEAETDFTKAIPKCQDSCDRMYGYRRVWRWLEIQGTRRKTVSKVTKKYGLLSRRRKWVQPGQRVHQYENLLNRSADELNSK